MGSRHDGTFRKPQEGKRAPSDPLGEKHTQVCVCVREREREREKEREVCVVRTARAAERHCVGEVVEGEVELRELQAVAARGRRHSHSTHPQTGFARLRRDERK